jgi:hypothetical protein
MAVVPPVFVVKFVSGVVFPTGPPNVVVPVLLAVRLNDPLRVSPNEMEPAPALKVVFAPNVTGLFNVIVPFVVVRSPLSVATPV